MSPQRAVMWAAIGLSAALGGLLLGLGWDDRAAGTTAAAALLLACVAVCIWAGAQGRVADREVHEAVARIAAARRARAGGSATNDRGVDGR